jgi:hypothetical protein
MWNVRFAERQNRGARGGSRSHRAISPDGNGTDRGDHLELGVYIGMELDRGRALFDVLGDPFVWTKVQDDPLLLSKVANDERVLAALARTEARRGATSSPHTDPGRSLPQNGGGAAR